MISRKEYIKAQIKAGKMFRDSGLRISDKEIDNIEVADFGLSDLKNEGAQILTFFSTDRVSAKVIALFPNQTLPEHQHTAIGTDPGKEETVRAIEGTLYLYIPGDDTLKCGFVPKGKNEVFTVRHEIIMKSGDQITLKPGTKHWFQSGSKGTVMYSISSTAVDAMDPFTDPDIVRFTKIID